ncbi:MAG: VCBS repeat-containing protein [Bacteroidota bacterium]
MKTHYINTLFIIPFLFGMGCKEKEVVSSNTSTEDYVKGLHFEKRTIIDSVNFLWAHDPIDVTNDGIADLVFVDTNNSGGQFGFFEGKKESGAWERHLIDLEGSIDQKFAMGDIEGADIDNDGDIDIVVAQHQGEWKASTNPSKIYWYENPEWKPHFVGEAPNFIKDVSIADFNGDQQPEIAVLTFENSTLSIFQKGVSNGWSMVQQYLNYKNLHEGMDVGDVNGDGYTDIVAEAHVFYSPGEDLKSIWDTENIDPRWNTQTGDWSRNGTKIFLRDLDGDHKSEVFISHSEREGYPLSYYSKNNGQWTEQVIADSIPACHTLQVHDFDRDGIFDVLAGTNKSRGQDLGYTDFPVTLFKGNEGYIEWHRHIIANDGIYNGQVIDYDGDGDLDIFRYQTHDAVSYELFENTLNK